MTRTSRDLTKGSPQASPELRELIHAGHWSACEQLPSTRALAERFRLSLPTIRSVLFELEAQGLIQCRSNTPGRRIGCRLIARDSFPVTEQMSGEFKAEGYEVSFN